MSRTAAPDLSRDARRLVLAILADHLPANAKVWVCGSRATGRARRYSDLDLAIDAGRRLTLDETARLADAFRDSDLPTGSILSIGTASPSGSAGYRRRSHPPHGRSSGALSCGGCGAGQGWRGAAGRGAG